MSLAVSPREAPGSLQSLVLQEQRTGKVKSWDRCPMGGRGPVRSSGSPSQSSSRTQEPLVCPLEIVAYVRHDKDIATPHKATNEQVPKNSPDLTLHRQRGAELDGIS